jgi:hypothetical protein
VSALRATIGFSGYHLITSQRACVDPLLTSAADLEALWQFANDDPVERAILLAALQAEADRRGITLVRVAQQRRQETDGVVTA